MTKNIHWETIKSVKNVLRDIVDHDFLISFKATAKSEKAQKVVTFDKGS